MCRKEEFRRLLALLTGGENMTKIVLTFGLISGVIIAALVWLNGSLIAAQQINWDRAELLGYASMLIALSMVFFGIKSYRDKHAGGTIGFWKGLKVGLLISLIAGVIYFVGAWSYGATHPAFVDQFMDAYKQKMAADMTAKGSTQEEIDKARGEGEQMVKLMRNPFIFFCICLIEIMPVALVVTLISAALLRKREILAVGPA